MKQDDYEIVMKCNRFGRYLYSYGNGDFFYGQDESVCHPFPVKIKNLDSSVAEEQAENSLFVWRDTIAHGERNF